jgi:hypothetical protein
MSIGLIPTTESRVTQSQLRAKATESLPAIKIRQFRSSIRRLISTQSSKRYSHPLMSFKMIFIFGKCRHVVKIGPPGGPQNGRAYLFRAKTAEMFFEKTSLLSNCLFSVFLYKVDSWPYPKILD